MFKELFGSVTALHNLDWDCHLVVVGGLRAPVTPRAMLAGVLYSWQGHPCQNGSKGRGQTKSDPLALQVGGWAEG